MFKKELNFIERIKEMFKKYNIKEGRNVLNMPVGLCDFLSYVKEKKDVRRGMDDSKNAIEDKTANNFPMPPVISVERDNNGYVYIQFDDDKGNNMAIIQDDLKYSIFESTIFVKESALQEYVTEWMEKARVKDFEEDVIESYKKAVEKLGTDQTEDLDTHLSNLEKVINEFKGSKAERDKRKEFIETIKGKESRAEGAGIEIIDRLLDEFEKILERRAQEKASKKPAKKHFNIDCDIAVAPGSPKIRPTGPVNRKAKPEYAKRFDDIEKITGCEDYFTVNNGEYRGYDYDLADNQNGETGYMIFLEPRVIDFNGAGTVVTRLSLDEFSKIKAKLEAEEQAKENPKEVTDDMVKANFAKTVLESIKGQSRAKRIRHRGGKYDEFIKRIKYYATGSKEYAKKYPYLAPFRRDLFKVPSGGVR